MVRLTGSPTIEGMETISTLGGVMAGGLLVLLGDFVRRRVEWRRQQATRLVDTGTDLIVLLHGWIGDLIDMREAKEVVPDPHIGRAARLQASTRFYALPGSRSLRTELGRVQIAHQAVRNAYCEDEGSWLLVKREYYDAVEDFEIALHSVLLRGRPPRDRGKPVYIADRQRSA
ncbi:hypothetical protein GCM10023170_092200 [Phytohabitans houttuyneae]|uniref:Uncharacterized protein n=1 Tax=Phytohabitans houttuyneae TaxID=1076126 RepID=A0A6V8K9C0_9ACTN|nr:hypothetical protein Phou_015150 [Phytohabitans houttuyneae]